MTKSGLLGERMKPRGAIRACAVILALAGVACQADYRDPRNGSLSESDALKLAADLANRECLSRFSQAPFIESSFAIEYRDGRWFWGSVDPRGIHGYSAEVSFDSHGAHRAVDVFFSTDTSAMRIRDSEKPKEE